MSISEIANELDSVDVNVLLALLSAEKNSLPFVDLLNEVVLKSEEEDGEVVSDYEASAAIDIVFEFGLVTLDETDGNTFTLAKKGLDVLVDLGFRDANLAVNAEVFDETAGCNSDCANCSEAEAEVNGYLLSVTEGDLLLGFLKMLNAIYPHDELLPVFVSILENSEVTVD